LRRHLSERETVELVGVTAAYNMVSRFLVATGIHPD
jgi:alkylhydroperoxidase family enzyme